MGVTDERIIRSILNVWNKRMAVRVSRHFGFNLKHAQKKMGAWSDPEAMAVRWCLSPNRCMKKMKLELL